MKIAVPSTQANTVDSHFGHCEFFTVFTISGNKQIENKEIVPSTQGCGCKSNIASTLSGMGVEIMLAGNMGGGAINILNQNGIKVIRGCSGDTTQVVSEFVDGKISDSGETCDHHEHHNEEGHSCENHHI